MNMKNLKAANEAQKQELLKLHKMLAGAFQQIDELLEALKEIAGGYHCGTEGCTIDNPCCDVMVARAAIVKAEKTNDS